MHLLRQAFLFIALFASAIAAECQQPLAKSLLWRITGNGLTKPSYLFGTMHLNDKRLFKFDDSVYKALENTEGMAIEVNPDEMAAYFANQLFDEVANEKKLKEILGNKDFDKYSHALSKKFNKSADNVTVGDVVKEKHKWMSEYMAKGEMPTFVDAYLYNIARRQGKWVGGIEDIADQAGLIDEMVDKSDLDYLLAGDSGRLAGADFTIDKMISLYTSQDIEGIESYSGSSTSPENMDLLLVKRNIKMARRIDSLTALRSMFLAIGSAHLAGDSGVIKLLQKRGFTLEPVFCSKKTYAKDYTFKEVHIPWMDIEDLNNSYKISMPGNPAAIKLYGLIDMRFLLDIFNMSGFCTMAIMSPNNFSNKDSVYKLMVGRMFKSDKNYTLKNVSNNGIDGKEFISAVPGESIRLQVFITGKMVYMVLLTGLKKELLTSEDANKFFSSFKMGSAPKITSKSFDFTDSIMGVSFSAPAKLEYNKQFSDDENKSWKVTGYAGVDIASGSYTMLFSKEVRPGWHILSDSTVYSDFFENMKGRCDNLNQEMIDFHGRKAQKVTGNTKGQPGVFATCINIIYNSRNILLMVVTDSTNLHSPQIENIYNSFRFIDHKTMPWQVYNSPDTTFNSWAPGRFLVHESTDELTEVISYDTMTSTTYHVIVDTLDKYSWYENDSSFWKQIERHNLSNKILVGIQQVTNGELRGEEILMKATKEGETYSRARIIVNGNFLYKLYASGEKDFLYSNNINKFFSSFRSRNPLPDQEFITKPKSAILMEALASDDSLTRRRAYDNLDNAPFLKSDSTLLFNNLFKKFRSPYNTNYYTTINEEIGIKLIDLKLLSLVSFLTNKFNSFTKDDSDFKLLDLDLLARTHTQESYVQFAHFYSTSPLHDELSFNTETILEDSLALLAGIYPELLKLAGDTTQAAIIAALGIKLVDSGYFTLPKLAEHQNEFIHVVPIIMKGVKDVKEDYLDFNYRRLVELLGRFNSEASNKVLKDLLSVKNKELLKEVVVQLAKNNQVVAPAVINKLASDPKYRHELYTQLNKINKKTLIPAQFQAQSSMAESIMSELAYNDEEEEASKIQFITKKTASYKGKKFLFYLYKVTFNNEDGSTSYLGISGAFELNNNSPEPSQDISGLYVDETFNSSSIDTFFKAWLKQNDKDSIE